MPKPRHPNHNHLAPGFFLDVTSPPALIGAVRGVNKDVPIAGPTSCNAVRRYRDLDAPECRGFLLRRLRRLDASSTRTVLYYRDRRPADGIGLQPDAIATALTPFVQALFGSP